MAREASSLLSEAAYGTESGNMVDGPRPGIDGHFYGNKYWKRSRTDFVSASQDAQRFEMRALTSRC